MLINVKVCVEPNTPSDQWVEQLVELPRGLLRQVSILIPPGHSGLTGIRIRYGLEYIIPWHSDSWISGDGEKIIDYPFYILPDNPTDLVIEAYNESQNYTHCFYIYFIVDKEMERLEQLLYNVIDKLSDQIMLTKKLLESLGIEHGVKE